MTLHKLGKAKARIDVRTLQMAKYLLPALPPPPHAVNWTDKISKWPMYGNDVLGDCVEAASGHQIQIWEAYAQGSLTNIPTQPQIIQAYSGAAGYIPGQPNTDQGTDMLTFLNYWRKVGVGGHKIFAYVKLKIGDIRELKQSVELFGGAFIGLQLPVVVQGADRWTTPDSLTGNGAPGSWGGHCVPVAAYKKRLSLTKPKTHHLPTTVITWGQTLAMTGDFYKTYSDEAYAVLSMDWFEKSKTAPNNFDLSALEADLKAIG